MKIKVVNAGKCMICGKCYKKFQKYMETKYDKFFTFLNKSEREG